MPRKPRIYMAGMPYHVIQRGNNRQACFYAEQDYLFYLECLTDACRRYTVALHAYVLMSNHVHLITYDIFRTFYEAVAPIWLNWSCENQ